MKATRTKTRCRGSLSTRKSQVWMAFCHTFISQEKKVHTDRCLPHSTFVNSVEPMEATWSYHHFESGGPMPCVPSKTFLELSLWYTRSCTHRLKCLVCATVSKVVVLCGETWACPTGGWKGPHQIQQVFPILKSTVFFVSLIWIDVPVCRCIWNPLVVHLCFVWLFNPSNTRLVSVLLNARGRLISMCSLYSPYNL